MFYDTDCGGVVSNIAYLRFIEKARTALFASMGMPPADMKTTQLFPVVARTEVDYLRPAKLGDKLIVKTWINHLEKVRIHCAFEIVRAEQTDESSPEKETVFVQATQKVALVQMPSGRPRRVPADWLKEVDS